MNRDLLDALGAVASHFYFDALRRYPGLMLDTKEILDQEALIVWQVLTAIDELALAMSVAKNFDNHQCTIEMEEQEELPF